MRELIHQTPTFQLASVAEEVPTFDSFVDHLASSALVKGDTKFICDSSLVVIPAAMKLCVNQDGWITDFLWGSIGYTTGG